MRDDLDRIAAALAAVAEDVDARTLADAVWLAATAPPPVQGAPDPADDPQRDTRRRDGTPGQAPTAPRQTAAAMPLSERRVSGAPARGIPVRVPVPPPLPQAAAIARALRPFTRPWRQGTSTQLDIDATVDRYAEHRVLIPVLRTAPERWFDVVVVVDDAPTMAVWHDTVTEFTHVLARTGFFRAVHRWTLTDTDVKDHLGRTTAVADAAATARVPHARRLVLIVSDFARTAWRGSALWELVTAWARATPAALVNPLPVRFWAHSGMDLPAVRATTTGAPGPMSTLHFRMPLRARLTGGPWLPVPALALTPAALDRWARTIVRADPDGCDAVLVPARWAAPPPAPATPGPAAEAFLRTAAAPAARLALLSAPFEHFSLPLLRLLQANAVPEADPADLAELLISGLATIDDPRAVNPVLTYHPAARDHLLNHVTADDVWTAHQALTSFIAAHSDVTPSMLALAHTLEGQVALPAEVRSFAAATTETLRLLGVLSQESPAPSGTLIKGDVPTRGLRSVLREEGPERLATAYPIGSARVENRDPSHPAASTARASSMRVLVVESQGILAAMAVNELNEAMPCEVTVVADPIEALVRLDREHFDVAVVDLLYSKHSVEFEKRRREGLFRVTDAKLHLSGLTVLQAARAKGTTAVLWTNAEPNCRLHAIFAYEELNCRTMCSKEAVGKLTLAVEAAAQGRAYIDPILMMYLPPKSSPSLRETFFFSPTRRAVWRALALGLYSHSQIAKAIGIAPGTVRKGMVDMRAKLLAFDPGCSLDSAPTSELIRYASQNWQFFLDDTVRQMYP